MSEESNRPGRVRMSVVVFAALSALCMGLGMGSIPVFPIRKRWNVLMGLGAIAALATTTSFAHTHLAALKAAYRF
ncbi:MAG: hypothetical protein JSR98_00690 [Proteobacteria bacterium]|nr:hypothetical protein [Pseudomonadota bacterium]